MKEIPGRSSPTGASTPEPPRRPGHADVAEREPRLGPLRSWVIVLALSAGSFLFVTAETLPIGLLSELSTDLHVTESTTGRLVTVYAFCVMAAAVPLSVVVSSLNRRWLMTLVFATFALANVASALAPNYAVLLAARTGNAMAQAVFWAAAVSLAGRLLPGRRRAGAISLVYAGISMAQLVGVPGGAALGHRLGWRAAMALMALAGAVTLSVLAVTVPAVRGTAPVRMAPLLRLLRRGRIQAAVVATAAAFVGTYVAFTYISALLQRLSGVPEHMISLFLLVFGAAGVAGNALAGVLAGHRPRGMLYLSVGGLLTVMVVFGLAAHWTVVVVVAVLAWGLCGSAMPTTFTTWVLGLAPADPEAVTSLLVVAVNFGLGAGALLGGRLLDDVGPHGVVWGAAMVLAVALGALFAAVRRPASA